MDFKLVSDFKPTGDQPQAIEKISGKQIAQNYLYMFASGKLLDLKNEI